MTQPQMSCPSGCEYASRGWCPRCEPTSRPAKMRVAELFAGAGGMALGLKRAGMETVWLAEIAEFPRRVLSARFAGVPLYGDVTELDGAALVAAHGPIDLVAGGSPCQGLSVAGLRLGLEDVRSALFDHQMRLWHETGADLCLWENVAGALSSHDGHDFAAVLSAFVGAAVAVPRDGWTGERKSGVVSGPSGVAAWRCLDAQWVALDGRASVPQRRLRVFVLGTRTGRIDPAEVLLEPESVFGHSAPRRETREGVASTPRSGVAETFCVGGRETGPHGSLDGKGLVCVPIQEVGKRTGKSTTDVRAGVGIGEAGDPMYTLQAGAQHGVVSLDAEGNASEDLNGTLSSHHSSHNRGAVVAFDTAQITSAANRSRVGPLSATLNESGLVHVCMTGDVTHSLTHEGHDASEDGTGRGTPIVARMVSFGEYVEDGTASCIAARDCKSATDLVVGTLDSRTNAGGFPGSDGAMAGHVQASAGIPRRLMPIECERLMGWPDHWTNVSDDNGKPASDSVRYKACGNGVVSHVAEWIGLRILATQSSLATPSRGAP